MIRWLLWLLGGLLLGGIVHLATVLLLPRTATQDAYARLAADRRRSTAWCALPAPTPDNAVLPFMDPAFAIAVCRYDLADGPLKLRVPVSQAYTSVSFYTRNGVAYYAINDRAAGRRIIELDLMTAAAARRAARRRGSHRRRPADRGIADPDRADRDARLRPRARPDADGAARARRRAVRGSGRPADGAASTSSTGARGRQRGKSPRRRSAPAAHPPSSTIALEAAERALGLDRESRTAPRSQAARARSGRTQDASAARAAPRR